MKGNLPKIDVWGEYLRTQYHELVITEFLYPEFAEGSEDNHYLLRTVLRANYGHS